MVAGGESEWFWCLAVVPGGAWWFLVVAASVRRGQVVPVSVFGAWRWFVVVPGGCR